MIKIIILRDQQLENIFVLTIKDIDYHITIFNFIFFILSLYLST